MRVTKKNQQQNGHREIVDAVKALCSEKDIEPEVLFSAIEEAMKAAYKKNVSRDEDAPSNLSVTMDRNTGDVHVFARKTITDDVEDPANQITLEEALKIRRDYRMGDIAEIDVTPNGFLRTAAQTAKQVIMQRIREAEQGRIYEEYSDKENEILTAIVQRVEPKGVYVELGRTEGIMEPSEYMPGEEYHIDDHIKVYVLEVNRTGREMLHGPQVRVSRIHPGLVKRLFEMEVPEIAAGVVQHQVHRPGSWQPHQDGRPFHRGHHRSRRRVRRPPGQPRGKSGG
ncbi:MAG: transcription termination/antitermination protein NusA [Lachnospiraceae bacterium]